jgi:hypothetical protein
MKLTHLIEDILNLSEQGAVLAASSTPEPGGLLLSPIEFDLYELHADALDLSFTSPFKVLKFLETKLGYKRIKEGEKIITHYRLHESNPLVAYFDGFAGEVVGVDEVGRPWVKYRDQDWEHAISASKVKSRSGVSPLETEEDNVQPRLLTLRLDPMDVQSYRFQMATLGYVYPRANLLSKNWMHILPKSPQPPLDLYDEEPLPEDEEQTEGEEKKAYYYDPLVTDLVSMSHEQMRYILDNAEEFLLDLKDDPDYIPDGDKPNFIDWNPPEGHTEGAYRALVDVLPDLEVDAKQALPSASYPPSGVKGAKAKRLWQELMTSKKFVKALRGRPPGVQWAIAHHTHVLRCTRNQVKPFGYWTPEHQKKFDTRHKAMQVSLQHKRNFMKAHGETPEQYRKRTGKCPKGFTYIPERKRCVHK